MASPAQARSREAEVEYLEDLRKRYEAEGFIFTIAPNRSLLPDFLGSYQPDALAQKPGLNIAIEVKQQQSQASQAQLKDIRRLFDGHPDWQFNVAFIGTSPLQSLGITPAAEGDIVRRIVEVRALSRQGHLRAAFIMAWSLLEAALLSMERDANQRPRTPGTVVQTLAMNGYIAPDSEVRLRDLVGLRNRIVHGDVLAEPSASDVNVVLDAVEQALIVGAA